LLGRKTKRRVAALRAATRLLVLMQTQTQNFCDQPIAISALKTPK
jgi:hypothetical protein